MGWGGLDGRAGASYAVFTGQAEAEDAAPPAGVVRRFGRWVVRQLFTHLGAPG